MRNKIQTCYKISPLKKEHFLDCTTIFPTPPLPISYLLTCNKSPQTYQLKTVWIVSLFMCIRNLGATHLVALAQVLSVGTVVQTLLELKDSLPCSLTKLWIGLGFSWVIRLRSLIAWHTPWSSPQSWNGSLLPPAPVFRETEK